MAYQSKLEYIQRKLAEEGSQHGFVDDIDFGKKWKEILSASQIMNPQESGNVQTFEAERTVWNFYWSKYDIPFPGRDPRNDYTLTPPQLSNSSQSPLPSPNQESDVMEAVIRSKLKNIHYLQGREPVLGWNSTTGEPWLALRTTVLGRMIGASGRNLIQLERNIRATTSIEFTIVYVKFSQYALIWPQFKSLSSMGVPGAWEAISLVWSYLNEWITYPHPVPWIDLGFRAYMERHPNQRQPIVFPPGFPFELVEDNNDIQGPYNNHGDGVPMIFQEGSCNSFPAGPRQQRLDPRHDSVLAAKYDPKTRIAKGSSCNSNSSSRASSQYARPNNNLSSRSSSHHPSDHGGGGNFQSPPNVDFALGHGGNGVAQGQQMETALTMGDHLITNPNQALPQRPERNRERKMHRRRAYQNQQGY